jgi:hypothetical protein
MMEAEEALDGHSIRALLARLHSMTMQNAQNRNRVHPDRPKLRAASAGSRNEKRDRLP